MKGKCEKRECGELYRNIEGELYTFSPCMSNEITYECFCLMGGLENNKLCKVARENGSYKYYTYHNISRR